MEENLHPLPFVKGITKENDAVSNFLPDLGLCSSPAQWSSPAFQLQLISGQHASVHSCALWILRLTLNGEFLLQLNLFKHQGQNSSISEMPLEGLGCARAHILRQAGGSSWKPRNSSTLQKIFLNLSRSEFTANLVPWTVGILDLIYICLSYTFFSPTNCFPIKNEHFPQMLCLLSIFSYLEKCSSLCACLLLRWKTTFSS